MLHLTFSRHFGRFWGVIGVQSCADRRSAELEMRPIVTAQHGVENHLRDLRTARWLR
jgi:hypothetical protein